MSMKFTKICQKIPVLRQHCTDVEIRNGAISPSINNLRSSLMSSDILSMTSKKVDGILIHIWHQRMVAKGNKRDNTASVFNECVKQVSNTLSTHTHYLSLAF